MSGQTSCKVEYKVIRRTPDFQYGFIWVYDTHDSNWKNLDPTKSSAYLDQDSMLLLKISPTLALSGNVKSGSLFFNNFIPNDRNLYVRQLSSNDKLLTETDSNDTLRNYVASNIEFPPESSSNFWWNWGKSRDYLFDLKQYDYANNCLYFLFALEYDDSNYRYYNVNNLEVTLVEEEYYDETPISIIDNYNNSFTVNIGENNFPEGSNFFVSYSRGGTSSTEFDPNNCESITHGVPVPLEDLNSNFDDEYIQVQVLVSNPNEPEATPQEFYANAAIRQYGAPNITQLPKLSHLNSETASIEPQLNDKWKYEWTAQEFNASSKICGFVIKLYQNNYPMSLMSESPISYRDYLVWDFEKELCYLNGTKLDGNFELCGTPGNFGVDETIKVYDQYYGSFYFYPAEMDTDEQLYAENLKIGDIIKISVQPYTRYGENNEGAMLLGEEVFSDEYIITGNNEVSSRKNILKIKTSENTFETCEVLVKTVEGWKAALEVNIKTAEGWKASIE